MKALPRLMVAPNGGRKTKADHPALPLSMSEIIATAVDCFAAGAGGLHLHIRDRDGQHSLDAGQYRDTLDALREAVPEMQLQITTEAIGRYSPRAQRDVVRKVHPEAVSMSLAEMLADGDETAALRFYDHCAGSGIAVQHILYGAADLMRMRALLDAGKIAQDHLKLLFVLGRYSADQQSNPQDLQPFQAWLADCEQQPDWAVCAFGNRETDCLAVALSCGGKARVGFENSFWNRDGSIARSNAERVQEVKQFLPKQ
jgi:uncharacterized protein (DUF849 family)